jgi:hypothetical protein
VHALLGFVGDAPPANRPITEPQIPTPSAFVSSTFTRTTHAPLAEPATADTNAFTGDVTCAPHIAAHPKLTNPTDASPDATSTVSPATKLLHPTYTYPRPLSAVCCRLYDAVVYVNTHDDAPKHALGGPSDGPTSFVRALALVPNAPMKRLSVPTASGVLVGDTKYAHPSHAVSMKSTVEGNTVGPPLSHFKRALTPLAVPAPRSTTYECSTPLKHPIRCNGVHADESSLSDANIVVGNDGITHLLAPTHLAGPSPLTRIIFAPHVCTRIPS